MPHPRRQSQGPHVACGCPIVSPSLPGSWCLVWVRVSLESLISFSSDPSPHSAVLPRSTSYRTMGNASPRPSSPASARPLDQPASQVSHNGHGCDSTCHDPTAKHPRMPSTRLLTYPSFVPSVCPPNTAVCC
ncbi:hypothetical protein GQ607_006734 [Colletotrichum asianum]|uniref:Uncharacterized protein n=1 Tax=Colletotrichum asianum TaxID=702518 RepID=A0A8H3ZTN1_9PEZI|nr:hypothetical protein GQ607_006734 [Colletotrichum asianum]